jgi:adenine-specific DNA-methyltransferase
MKKTNNLKKIIKDDPETKSSDIVAQNIDQLKLIFPEAFTEGKIDFDVLKQLLGGAIDEKEEKYGLNWHGKRLARQLALTPSIGTLRPCPEESIDWDTTQNLMIEGDNLEVLKLLQKSYSGRIKLIYIDPPYNTGKDFVYPDNFQDNIRNYLELTRQIEGGQKTTSNTESSGRFHTDWLNMMYSRLKVAKNLLRYDGVIAISLDDSEISNARRILDELFGEDNFIAQLTIETDSRTRQYDAIGVTHEYILVYSRDESFAFNVLLDENKGFQYKDEQGGFDIYELRNRNVAFNKDNRRNLYYPFWVNPKNPDSNGFYKVALEEIEGWVKTYPQESQGIKTVWRWGKEKARGNLNTLLFGKKHSDGFFQIIKKYRGISFVHNSVWIDKDIKTDKGTLEIKALFENKKVFDHPKPVALITRLLDIFVENDGVILDFFAGSGTTGHSTMLKNTADSGNRQFILVQLPEPLDPNNKEQKVAADFCDKISKPQNIAEITKERLRRAAIKIKKENPMFAGDLGFKVFKLDSSNIKAWEPDRDDLPKTLQESAEHLKSDRTEEDILFELLLKLGLDLTVPIEKKRIARKTVYSIGAGTLFVCLDKKVNSAENEALALGIVEWHKELSPAGETTIVFRDSAFENDVAKTNLTAILQQHGLENVRSL